VVTLRKIFYYYGYIRLIHSPQQSQLLKHDTKHGMDKKQQQAVNTAIPVILGGLTAMRILLEAEA
jgi:hypothetical protein